MLRAAYCILCCYVHLRTFFGFTRSHVEQVLETSGHDPPQVVHCFRRPFARTVHGKRLAGTRLAVRKDGTVVSLDGGFNYLLPDLGEELFLR